MSTAVAAPAPDLKLVTADFKDEATAQVFSDRILRNIADSYEPVIYLAGHFKRDDYRAEATSYLTSNGYKVLDPFRDEHDLRGKEAGASQQIVKWDLEDIIECNAVLSNFTDMSVGTSMECWFAHSIGRPVYAFVDDPGYPYEDTVRISPWIEYVAKRNTAYRALEVVLVTLRNDFGR